MLASLKKNWFLIGIVLVICLAKIAPEIGSKGGILMPEITVKYIAVSVIFFNSGISLRSEDLGRALLQVKVHIFIQGFTFILFPAIIFTLVGALSIGQFNSHILEGLKILSCLPPPVSSAVILTKAVGGNEAAAIFNSAFGSFLGIAVTPTLILVLVGSKAAVPVASIFLQLTATVVLPLIVGQWVRRILANAVDLKQVPWGQIGSGVLLLIIYSTFCDTFSQKDIDVDPASFFMTVILIISIQLFLLYSVFSVSSARVLPFSRSDTVALMFCSTHKSLTLGIPIIKIIFADSPSLSLITIPLLVYHPTQILIGGLLVPYVRSWMVEGPRPSVSFMSGAMRKPTGCICNQYESRTEYVDSYCLLSDPLSQNLYTNSVDPDYNVLLHRFTGRKAVVPMKLLVNSMDPDPADAQADLDPYWLLSTIRWQSFSTTI